MRLQAGTKQTHTMILIQIQLSCFTLVFLSRPTQTNDIQNNTDPIDRNYRNDGKYFEDYRHFTDTTAATEINSAKGYEVILKWIKFAMTLTGFIGNSVAYITLSRNGKAFTNPTMLRLLKNQSVLDSIVCFIGGIFVLQPSMWRVSDHNLSYFICQVRYYHH